jgi:hypothetical protein
MEIYPMHARITRLIGGLGAAALLLAALGGPAANASSVHSEASTSAKEIAFRGAMAKYWEDHITWTRLFVVSAMADSPDLQAVTDRLLQNQLDIGNAIKPFYGEVAGDHLTALLKEHIVIAADAVAAAKAGDSARLQAAQARWEGNANDIGDFLAAANPDHWPADEMRDMMAEHLELTTREVVARLQGDWAADIAAYDQIHLHILTLSDMLAGGIIAQFPGRFS